MHGGVVELNILFVVAGLGVLYGAHGWQTWRAALREAGLAYVLGIAAVGVLATLSLIAGTGLSSAVVVALSFGVAAAGVAVGAVRRHPVPRTYGGSFARPRTVGEILTALAIAVTAIVVLGFLWAFRHAPLVAYDAWNFWVPKAKTIYFFNGLDLQLFRTLPAPSYPLLVPTLDAMVFRLTHSTDPTALAQQNWFMLAGLVAALGSLLAPLSRRGLVWLFLASFVVLPEVAHRWFQLLADWTLDGFFVVSAVLLVRWLYTREAWLLWVAPLPIAAALVTKREGQLLIACLLVGALAATAREWRRAWPPLVGGTAIAYVVSQLPWRIWWTSHHLPSDLHEGGIGHTGSLHRVVSSARVVAQLQFSYGMWALAVPLALLACLACWSHRRGRPAAVLYLVTGALAFVGFTWVMWSDPSIPLDGNPALNPIPREVASTALLSLVFAPVLVSTVLADVRLSALELGPVAAGRKTLGRAYDVLVGARPAHVLGTLVVLQWILVAGLAATVRHAGWIFYQGGDQLWYYTTGWLLAHGQFPQPGVGYLWCVLLAPIGLVSGRDLVQAFPSIIALQFVILLPVALLAIYGIGARLAGRLFGYWTAALWLLVPLLGIGYTDTGYHQRFTEVLLPQGFGLTAMADFPTTVAALVSAYFLVRWLTDGGRRVDALASGLAAGAAIAIKPSTALFLLGPMLALAAARRRDGAAWFTSGLAPALVALAFVKWRGFGYVPLFHADPGIQTALGAHSPLVASLPLHHYLPFSWSHFTRQLDLLREHFWSARLVEWAVLAGAIGILVRSRRIGLLVVGWFAGIVLIKTGSGRGSLEDGSLLRILMPAYPAFVLMLASTVFVWPGLARRVPRPPVPPLLLGRRARSTGIVAAALLTAVVPALAYAVASPVQGPSPRAVVLQEPPIPVGLDLGVRARRSGGNSVTIAWRPQQPSGGPVFYHVFRAAPGTAAIDCKDQVGNSAALCQFLGTDLGATRATQFVDRSASPQAAAYYVGVAANWLDDTTQGDVYALGRPATVPAH